VSVSYSLQSSDGDHFEGEFTIVNNGSSAVSGWQLAVTFPGDQVDWVWEASWHMSGDTLIMSPSGDQVTIGPGASLTEHVAAQGSATSPASCTFNGSAC
jgi:cellulase/cellobiase CelA1